MSNELRPIAIDLDSENPFEELEKMLDIDAESIARRKREDECVHEIARSVSNYLKNNALGKPGLESVQTIGALLFTMGIGLALADKVPGRTLMECLRAALSSAPDREYARSFFEPFGISVDEFAQRVYGTKYEQHEITERDAYEGQ